MSIACDLDDGSEGSNSSVTHKRTHSSVWTHFDRLEIDESGRRKAQCRICHKTYLADNRSGTSNLKRHLAIHVQNEDQTTRLTTVDHDIYREKVAIAIIKHDYPFQFVEHEGIRELHSFLNSTVKNISRNTAKSDVLKIYRKEKEKVKKELELVSSRICLTSDLWTSITTDGYMSLTAHFINQDWELKKRILIFRHVPPPHNGQSLAEKLISYLKEWGIEKKIFTITLDNAKYNDRVIRLLQNYFLFDDSSICGGEFIHIRCGAHVLNLIVKAGLDVIEGAICKIRESVKYVKGSELRTIRFAEMVKELSLETNKRLRQDVATRWNSTFLMLERALLYRRAFSRLQDLDDDYNLCPSDEEWRRVERISEFLKPFYDMTRLFSGSKYPTTNLYFPSVWKIQCLLNEEVNSADFLIRDMAILMKAKFEKYWECYSVILSFAIILDPRYKLQFVEYCFSILDLQSRDEKVLDIKQKLFRLFEEYTKSNTSTFTVHAESVFNSGNRHARDLMDGFDTYQSQYGTCGNKSELELYLEERLVDRKQQPNLDILTYWKESKIRYPELSHMARDILSIPITTVASESAFSHGGRILGKFRTSILQDNVEALLCSRDWLYESEAILDDPNEHTEIEQEDEEQELGVDISSFVVEQDVSSNIDG